MLLRDCSREVSDRNHDSVTVLSSRTTKIRSLQSKAFMVPGRMRKQSAGNCDKPQQALEICKNPERDLRTRARYQTYSAVRNPQRREHAPRQTLAALGLTARSTDCSVQSAPCRDVRYTSWTDVFVAIRLHVVCTRPMEVPFFTISVRCTRDLLGS